MYYRVNTINVSKKGKARLNIVMDASDLRLLVSARIPWGNCILSPELNLLLLSYGELKLIIKTEM